MYLPMILMGSAMAVTYKSDEARFTIKIPSTFLKFFRESTLSRMRILPNVPTTVASIRISRHGRATSVLEFINSYLLKYVEAFSSFGTVSFISTFKSSIVKAMLFNHEILPLSINISDVVYLFIAISLIYAYSSEQIQLKRFQMTI